MALQSELIKQSDILNQLVIDIESAEELGRVDHVWMIPESHKVMGLVCKSGLLGSQKKLVTLSQIAAIGSDGVMINFDQTEVIAEEPKQSTSMIGHEVWSDGGDRVGKITDLLFDAQTGEVMEYLFVSSGWRGVTEGTYLLPPASIRSLGTKRIIISETSAQEPVLYSEGLRQKVTQARESITEQAKDLTEQAKERAQTLTEQAKERAQSLGEQVKERAQSLGDQARERSQALVDQVKERSQTLTDQAKDQLSQDEVVQGTPSAPVEVSNELTTTTDAEDIRSSPAS